MAGDSVSEREDIAYLNRSTIAIMERYATDAPAVAVLRVDQNYAAWEWKDGKAVPVTIDENTDSLEALKKLPEVLSDQRLDTFYIHLSILSREDIRKFSETSRPAPRTMTQDPAAHWQHIQQRAAAIRTETARVIVGQDEIVEQLLTALLCKGHCLLVGVPGLAKTLLVSTLGRILGLKFQRIQFTPDLMPTDIVGSEILQTAGDGSREFQFAPGPIFANLILADEINRTPPKTQAALLEAMQEKQVTVAGHTRRLEEPFIVFATQNPIEHEGTYPLPEAQLDRFFFELRIGYPSIDEEAGNRPPHHRPRRRPNRRSCSTPPA